MVADMSLRNEKVGDGAHSESPWGLGHTFAKTAANCREQLKRWREWREGGWEGENPSLRQILFPLRQNSNYKRLSLQELQF
eukprot:3936418-Rhodomonas_salina.1